MDSYDYSVFNASLITYTESRRVLQSDMNWNVDNFYEILSLSNFQISIFYFWNKNKIRYVKSYYCRYMLLSYYLYRKHSTNFFFLRHMTEKQYADRFANWSYTQINITQTIIYIYWLLISQYLYRTGHKPFAECLTV